MTISNESGRHVEIRASRFGDRHRPAGERARHTDFVDVGRKLLGASETFTTGAAPNTMAIGIGSWQLLCFCQARAAGAAVARTMRTTSRRSPEGAAPGRCRCPGTGTPDPW